MAGRRSLHNICVGTQRRRYPIALEDLSLIEYDQERQLVEPTPQFDQLQPQLSAIIDADPGLEAPVGL